MGSSILDEAESYRIPPTLSAFFTFGWCVALGYLVAKKEWKRLSIIFCILPVLGSVYLIWWTSDSVLENRVLERIAKYELLQVSPHETISEFHRGKLTESEGLLMQLRAERNGYRWIYYIVGGCGIVCLFLTLKSPDYVLRHFFDQESEP